LQHSKHAISSIAQQKHKQAKLKTKKLFKNINKIKIYQSKQGPPPRKPFGKLFRVDKPFAINDVSFFIIAFSILNSK